MHVDDLRRFVVKRHRIAQALARLELLRRRQRGLHLERASAEQLHLVLQPHGRRSVGRRIHRLHRHAGQGAAMIRHLQPGALAGRHGACVVLRFHRHHAAGLDKARHRRRAFRLAYRDFDRGLAARAADGQRRRAHAVRHLGPAHIHRHALLARDLAGRLVQRDPRLARGDLVIERLLAAIEDIDEARALLEHIQRRQGEGVAARSRPNLLAAFHRHAHVGAFGTCISVTSGITLRGGWFQ
jgi:hypothetical protein